MTKAALDKVLGCLDTKGLIAFTRQVARIPSVHGDEKKISRAFALRMKRLGLKVETPQVEPGRNNVVGWLRGAGGGDSLTFNGHVDTVFEALGWTKKLYGGELVNGKIYGHGVSNMKASDAAMVYAADAIRRSGVKLKGDLLVALVVGECHGGVGTLDLMKKGYKTDRFVCGEPTYLTVLTVHADSQFFRVNITGRTGHFGSHDHGVNAIIKLMELVQRLGPVQVEMRKRGWLSYKDKPLYDGLPRYHIGTIRGGLTKEFSEGPSSTPDYCSGIINVRATPNKSIESTKADLARVLDKMRREDPGFRYEIEIMRQLRGFEAPPRSKVVKAVCNAYRTIAKKKPVVGGVQPYMFMASDSGNMQAAGMTDGVLFGPGKFTSSVIDEHVEVDKLIQSAKIYAAAALEICGVRG